MPSNDDLPVGERINRSMNLTLLAASALAFPAIIFLHRDLGRRYAGPQALLSVAMLFFWPLITPNVDPHPMLWLLAATLLMCFWSRMNGLHRKAMHDGDPIYRHYDGTPRLMRLCFCRDELLFKRLHEPIIVFIASVTAHWLIPPLANFLLASAAALFFTVNASAFAHCERIEAMRDRIYEQKCLTKQFRALGGK